VIKKSRWSKLNLIFILSIAPILGVFLQGILAILTGIEFRHFLTVTLFLNWGLAFQDMIRLKANGDYVNEIGSPWLIPMYLSNQAKVMNKPPIYAIIWTAACIFVFLTPSNKIMEFIWLLFN